jgi:hypothetical protein
MFNAIQDIPSPITTFDLSEESKFAENYEKCIKAIQNDMKDQTDVKFTFAKSDQKEKEVVVPVTPAEDFTRNGVYVIRLEFGGKRLDIVAERYQTWLRGIVTNSGHRFEIDDKLPKIMKNSISLHTTGIYPKLIQYKLEEVTVGYQELLSAFHTLAGFEGKMKDLDKVKEAIAIILVMFFEGPRLLPVQELTKNALSLFSSAEVGEKNARLINNWCDDSMVFYDNMAGTRKVTISDDTSPVVRNAVQTFGIMCRSNWQNMKRGGKKPRGESSKRR